MPFVNFSDSIQYIIGIDFGNGETSAAACDLNNDLTPTNLTFMNNSKIATAISLDENGAVRLGFDTLNEEDPKQFGAYLKGRPSELDNDPRRKQLYIRFVQEIYKEIKSAMKKSGKELTNDNHLVFVACPSMSKDWNEEEKVKYAKFMAEECGLPILKHSVFDVEEYGVFRESRAAYVKYKGSNDAKGDEENILVIDFGSSTIDMTYHSKTAKPIDKGYTTIGAQRVEELMTEWSVSPQNTNTNDGERSLLRELYDDIDGKGWKEHIKLVVRKSKQEYYSGSPNAVQISLRPREITRNPALPFDIHIYIPRNVVDNDILSGYKEDIKSCFENFKKEQLQGKPISTIILTGGASGMMWIEDVIKGSFPNARLFHPINDNAASLLVSNGIAVAGRVEIKMIQMLRQLRSEISNIKIDSTFVDSITESIVDKVIKIVDEVFAEIAAPDSPYDTINKIQARIESKTAGVATWASSIISDNYNNYYENYKSRLQNLCQRYFPGVNIADYQKNTLSPIRTLDSNLLIGKQELMYLSITASTIAVNSVLTVLGVIFTMFLNVGALVANLFVKLWNFFFDKKRQKLEYISLAGAITKKGLEPNDKLSIKRRKQMHKGYEKNKEFLQKNLKIEIKKVLENEIDINTITGHIRKQVEDYVVNAVKDIRHLLR